MKQLFLLMLLIFIFVSCSVNVNKNEGFQWEIPEIISETNDIAQDSNEVLSDSNEKKDSLIKDSWDSETEVIEEIEEKEAVEEEKETSSENLCEKQGYVSYFDYDGDKVGDQCDPCPFVTGDPQSCSKLNVTGILEGLWILSSFSSDSQKSSVRYIH